MGVGSVDPMGKSKKFELVDVPKMDYIIGYGDLWADTPSIILIHSFSYQEGVTLESVTWEVNNAFRTSGENAKIDITITDIAGTKFGDFMALRTLGSRFAIFIAPPKSDGSLADDFLKYKVDGDSVSVEFSQSTGFTYSVSGTLYETTANSIITNAQAFNITGNVVGEGQNFKAYIEKEFVPQWNKVNKSQIKVTIKGKDQYYTHPPVQTKQKNKDSSKLIEPFTVQAGMSVKEAIIGLYNERFAYPRERQDKGVMINVFVKKIPAENQYEIMILFLDKDDKKEGTKVATICCGPDSECGSGVYRGEIGNLNFNSILDKFYTIAHCAVDSKDYTNTGTDVHAPKKNKTEKSKVGDKVTEISNNNMAYVKQVCTEKNEAGIWKSVGKIMNEFHMIEFAIEVSMPYSFGLSPQSIGGEIPEVEGGFRLFKQNANAELLFYWYSDASCESYRKNEISGLYRIEKVSHTFGNGDMGTRVFLSHIITE